MNRRAGQRGTSLIETIVSVGLLAAIAGALGPAVHASVKSAARIEDRTQGRERARVGEELIGQLFDSFVATDRRDDTSRFRGAPLSLEFWVLQDMRQGPAPVQLNIVEGKVSVRIGVGTTERTTLIFENVRAFRYYGRESPGATVAWRSDWDAPTPPTLVEVVFFDAGASDRERRHTFRISTRAAIVCEFDPVSRQCSA